MKCRKCISPIEADSRFCRHCGAKVVRVMAAGVAATSDRAEKSASRNGSPSRPRSTASNGNGGSASPQTRIKDQAHALTPVPTGDVYRDPQFEQPIWQGRPTWRASMGLWTLWFLISGCCLYGASRYTAGDSSLVQVTWIFVVGSAVMILVREALVVYGMSYHLTTQRLFIHRGILTRVSDQMELVRIDDVRLMQSLTDRLMNTGNVEIFSSDESEENINLKSISAPVEFAEAIRLHVRGARSKGTLSVESL